VEGLGEVAGGIDDLLASSVQTWRRSGRNRSMIACYITLLDNEVRQPGGVVNTNLLSLVRPESPRTSSLASRPTATSLFQERAPTFTSSPHGAHRGPDAT